MRDSSLAREAEGRGEGATQEEGEEEEVPVVGDGEGALGEINALAGLEYNAKAWSWRDSSLIW